MDKRTFLKSISLVAVSSSLPTLKAMDKIINKVSHLPAEAVASDEDFWETVRDGYRLKPDYINLENGYYCFLPQETLENHIDHIREINYQGSYYMRTVQWENKRKAAARLASIAGCSPEELIITRNTTESLDMIIGGQDWKKGDEAVMAEQDYGSMLGMFKQVQKRYGVVLKTISVPNHPKSDEEIVQLYEKVITPKTKLLMVCHMINITGQILPIRKICDMAHRKNVKVMVDGAHAFAHIKFSIPDLGCDFYGSSLHKWLSVPLGAGILYVKKEHINSIWPVFAPFDDKADDIYRLNNVGTHPVHTILAINNAIDYYEKIGAERKEARLRYLQNYWTSKVRDLPHIVFNTPADPGRSCGIANVGVKGMKPQDLAKTLMDNYKIFTVAIDGANVHGCRITPNIYTTTQELDVFVKALKELG
ncbi:MAG: aminotransferase class V-fold PLP-dependent enzyme [Cyclobacteriaceae bacterium]|nr:aminotransferase class V-fold PLP-dependent enzyme [Cyclobacteriaceae bacterium]UYN88376.1 MAG: aminotransferase class V-fold PLP-dependent enzyme [Cyclobacteriaceae bacterium]